MKTNLKVVTAFIFGLIISGIGAYAISVIGTDVSYDNTNSGLNATNVQDAADELYELYNSHMTKVVYVGTITLNTYSATIDCKSIEKYSELNVNNFLLDFTTFTQTANGSSANYNWNISKSYNPQTGILSVSRGPIAGSAASLSFKVYAYYN